MTDLIQRARDVAGRLSRKVHRGQYALGGASLSTDGKFTSWGGEKIMEAANPDGPEAAAIIAELIERVEWRDIETAPDGDVLVACVFYDGSAQLHVACRWGFGWGSMGLRDYQPIVDPAPSHWMPLPQPPSVLGKQEGEG